MEECSGMLMYGSDAVTAVLQCAQCMEECSDCSGMLMYGSAAVVCCSAAVVCSCMEECSDCSAAVQDCSVLQVLNL